MTDPLALAAHAATRCDFRLAFARTHGPRRMLPGFLDGPRIPDSRGPGTVDGCWIAEPGAYPDRAGEHDPAAWVDHFAGLALAQGVHEVLESFWVDGGPWLDPHDGDPEDVAAAVRVLCAALAGVRARRGGPYASDGLAQTDEPAESKYAEL